MTNRHIGIWLAGCLMVGSFSVSHAATIAAKSCSRPDVQNAIAQAQDGDLVVLPEGTAGWAETLTITKAITLRGQTIVSGPSSNPTVDRRTIIVNDIVGAGPGDTLKLNTTNGVVRVTGITFTAGTGNGYGAIINCESGTPHFRIDHNEFFALKDYRAVWAAGERGLVDHNVATSLTQSFFEPHHDDFGDASYATPLDLGTDHAIFVEDNYVAVSAAFGHVQGTVDSQAGARYVVRYNTSINSQMVTHGTESGGRNRGPRSWEIYNNTIMLEPALGQQANAALFRGGTGVMWGNTVTGNWGHFARLVNYRDALGLKLRIWHGADGINAWDLNDTSDQTGNGFGGGPGGLYARGTHSGPNGATTLTVSGAPWTTNQWAKFSIKNIDNPALNQSVIISNTNNTLTYVIVDPNLTFDTGQRFEIRRVIQSLDHVGSGQSDLLVGGKPTPHWLNQIIEPAYFWNNTLNGAPGDLYTEYNLRENGDFYNETASFDGTTGVGVGPLTNRPATCVKGVGYWATDENKFYKATAANTWTLYYTPYTYPHPLAQSNEPPPTNPTTPGADAQTMFVQFKNVFNPTRERLTIKYTLADEKDVTLTIRDRNGVEIRKFPAGVEIDGHFETSWDGRNSSGAAVASGNYVVTLKQGSKVVTKKVVAVK